ncbi:carboxymuconolactone decarboxylase family protein [Paraburkholderia kirstenboschensis]|uniref:carboxymuconolactone decarboxylase family protein n=1 Tax=Paraburkholderia kirstenboschensis TaxID=1245436 RepID=UPI003742FA7A
MQPPSLADLKSVSPAFERYTNRAMDNGLSQHEASEVLTQSAFYAGWPNVFSAMPVFKDVFSKRPA